MGNWQSAWRIFCLFRYTITTTFARFFVSLLPTNPRPYVQPFLPRYDLMAPPDTFCGTACAHGRRGVGDAHRDAAQSIVKRDSSSSLTVAAADGRSASIHPETKVELRRPCPCARARIACQCPVTSVRPALVGLKTVPQDMDMDTDTDTDEMGWAGIS